MFSDIAQLIQDALNRSASERNLLDRALHPRRFKERKPERNARILAKHREGWSHGKIAKHVGISRGAVCQVLRRRKKMCTTGNVPMAAPPIMRHDELGGMNQ
jgi:hypothetical protein